MKFEKDYWEFKWKNGQTGWDIGHLSPPIQHFIDTLSEKETKILIPGAGNAYEGEYLYKKDFKHTHLLDYSPLPFDNLLNRFPQFPKENLFNSDFFTFTGKYDLILEQTFFSAIPPADRISYASKMHDLLEDNGLLVGLLFSIEFGNSHPPFGGSKEEYTQLFSPLFDIEILETSYNSIAPRKGSELFIKLRKKII